MRVTEDVLRKSQLNENSEPKLANSNARGGSWELDTYLMPCWETREPQAQDQDAQSIDVSQKNYRNNSSRVVRAPFLCHLSRKLRDSNDSRGSSTKPQSSPADILHVRDTMPKGHAR